MSSESVIIVERLYKSYETYVNPRDRLKQLLLPPFQKILGIKKKNYYDDFHALTDISFEVKQGETFGIIGRNGSGKSTLLQILCGTMLPSNGYVTTRGKVAALLELGAGFNPEFSGRENVYMNGRLFGLSTSQIDERFDSIAAFADIGEFINKPVKTYSSGMYVRLAFAVTAHVDADILIIDEALSVGDAFFVQKCMRFLRKFVEKGTLLFVSHDTSALQQLCSRAILLEKGHLKKIGLPKNIVKSYLESLVSDTQVVSAAKSLNDDSRKDDKSLEYIDMRDRMLNNTNLRNDIELFSFNYSSDSFGDGQAKILDVFIEDVETSKRLTWIVGGEFVRLIIKCQAISDISSVIIGFDLKNRLGQTVFGENTFLTYFDEPQSAAAGQYIYASFEFRIPVMRSGDYAITAAIASGTQSKHVQHHWVHEAMILRSQPSRVCFGEVGLPMREIKIIVD